jgi:hypothetical protein
LRSSSSSLLDLNCESVDEQQSQAMKPEEARTALAVVELTLKQWEAGTLTKLEGGEPITAEHVAMWRREIEALRKLL